jgi:hypothetical protein
MNGKQWRIAILVGMLEYGEDTVSGEQVVDIAHKLFPTVQFPAWSDDADWEIEQTRKLSAFMREGAGICPTLMDRLSWALTGVGLASDRSFATEVRKIRENLGMVRKKGGSARTRPSINESEWHERKKPFFGESCTTLGTTRRVQAG